MVINPEGRASGIATVVSSVPQPARHTTAVAYHNNADTKTQTPHFHGFLSTRLPELRTLHTFSELLV
jgi:hypothetical protein